MEYNELLRKAEKQINRLQVNDIFRLKDLFRGTEWNNLERGDKLGFGKYFKNAVENGMIPNVVYIGKADNNSSQYKMK